MRQLDAGRGRHDPVVDARPELGGEQGEQRAEPLPTGEGQVRGRLGDEGVVVVDPCRDEVLHPREPAVSRSRSASLGPGQREDGGGPPLRRHTTRGAHRRNWDALPASWRSEAGATPATSVTMTPRLIATVEGTDGWRATTPSTGSVKYMSTMSRT